MNFFFLNVQGLGCFAHVYVRGADARLLSIVNKLADVNCQRVGGAATSWGGGNELGEDCNELGGGQRVPPPPDVPSHGYTHHVLLRFQFHPGARGLIVGG